MNILTSEYKDWLNELELRIRSAQAKLSILVNSALIGFYWEPGKMISEKDLFGKANLFSK